MSSPPSINDSSPSLLSLRSPFEFMLVSLMFFGRRFLKSVLLTSTSILESCDRRALSTFHTTPNDLLLSSMVSGLASGGMPSGIIT